MGFFAIKILRRCCRSSYFLWYSIWRLCSSLSAVVSGHLVEADLKPPLSSLKAISTRLKLFLSKFGFLWTRITGARERLVSKKSEIQPQSPSLVEIVLNKPWQSSGGIIGSSVRLPETSNSSRVEVAYCCLSNLYTERRVAEYWLRVEEMDGPDSEKKIEHTGWSTAFYAYWGFSQTVDKSARQAHCLLPVKT